MEDKVLTKASIHDISMVGLETNTTIYIHRHISRLNMKNIDDEKAVRI